MGVTRFFCVLAVAAAAGGCSDSGVGRKCNVQKGSLITGTQISSPALECTSRLCLIQKPVGSETTPRSNCTVLCDKDEDCAGANIGKAGDGLCGSKFVCAVAVVAGDFRCKRMCVCKDDLVCGTNGDVDGGVVTPSTCDPKAPIPSCT